MKAGLGAASSGPTADLPLAPPRQRLWLEYAPEPCQQESQAWPQAGRLCWPHGKVDQHRAEPFSRKPLVGSWGVGQNVTCGLAMDVLWDLAGLRILCLEIA